MSQTSSCSISQTLDPFGVSISFAKFSHVTTAVGAGKFAWHHDNSRGDMVFVVQSVRIPGEYGQYGTRITMKITAGTEILEYHDLTDVLQCANGYDPTSGVESPVQVMMKCPSLAMRYPKTVNTVRRWQIRFHNTDDFIKAVDIFRSLGLPLTERSADATPIPQPINLLGVGDHRSTSRNIGNAVCVPASSAQSSRISELKAMNCPIASPSPILLENSAPGRPSSGSSETLRSSSAIGDQVEQGARPSSTTSLKLSPIPRSLTEASQYSQKTVKDKRPMLKLQLQKVTEPFNTGMSSPQSSQAASQTRYDRDGPNSFQSFPTASPFFSSLHVPNGHDGLRRSLSSVPTEYYRLYQDQMLGKQEIAKSEAGSGTSQRPASTPADMSDMHDVWIPPRRILPFSKSNDTSKPRSSTVTSMPPLPKPTALPKDSVQSTEKALVTVDSQNVASTPLPKPAKKRVAQRKASIAPTPPMQKDATAIIEQHLEAPIKPIIAPVLEEEPSPLAAKSAAIAASRPSSASTGLQTKLTVPKKRAAPQPPARPASNVKKPKMVDSSTQTQTLSGRDHTTAMRDVQHHQVSRPVEAEQHPAPPPPPASFLNQLDAFVSKHKARPAPKELWQAPGYSTANDEQRLAMLNNFICDNLENEEFVKLCEDTENAWRRIGLGM